MKYTKKYIYKQKKKQTRKRKYKQKKKRSHKQKSLKKQKRTRRKRGGVSLWPFSEKNTDEKIDDTIPGSERWNEYRDTSQKLNDIPSNNGPVVIISSHQSRLLCELRGLKFLKNNENNNIKE